MSLKVAVDADLKQALLSGARDKVDTLRGLKAAILDIEVATGTREQGLSDAEIEKLIAREVKKRRESAELYTANGRPELAAAESAEIVILESYLPQQLDDSALEQIIVDQIAATQATSVKDLGRVIAAVKSQVGNSADGARIAQLVKSKLS